ncbi:MAG: VWA domain-containing protein [Treponema sp.]|jgi:Ca-activated chloride channel family protein|nr:VWA domain-containing protein [Treponema sp.]
MTFDNPFILNALFIVIPCFIIELESYRVRIPKLKLLGLLSSGLRTRAVLSTVFFDLFLMCCITGVAGPRWGSRVVNEYRRGVDLVFAFDVSRSMLAGDSDPSRLGRAVSVAREVVVNTGDVRLAIAMAKDRGVLALPLTHDKNALLSFLDSLEIVNMTGRGTNIENLLDAAGTAFLDAFSTKHIVVLFSDGESVSGVIQNAVDRAVMSDISIIAVGVGTDEGAVVPDMKRPDGSIEPTLDSAGTPIVSRRESAALRNVAQRSGGIYIDGNTPNAGKVLTVHIRELASETMVNSFHIETTPRWTLFIIAAILFFILSKYVEKKRA